MHVRDGRKLDVVINEGNSDVHGALEGYTLSDKSWECVCLELANACLSPCTIRTLPGAEARCSFLPVQRDRIHAGKSSFEMGREVSMNRNERMLDSVHRNY